MKIIYTVCLFTLLSCQAYSASEERGDKPKLAHTQRFRNTPIPGESPIKHTEFAPSAFYPVPAETRRFGSAPLRTPATAILPHLDGVVESIPSLVQRFIHTPPRTAAKGALPDSGDKFEKSSARKNIGYARGSTPGDFLEHHHTPRNKPVIPTQRSEHNPNAKRS